MVGRHPGYLLFRLVHAPVSLANRTRLKRPGSLGSTPKKQRVLVVQFDGNPHLIIEHIEAQHSQHGSQAFGLETNVERKGSHLM